MMDGVEQALHSRVEDLEEALRRTVVVVSPDVHHVECAREKAVLTIALGQLDLL